MSSLVRKRKMLFIFITISERTVRARNENQDQGTEETERLRIRNNVFAEKKRRMEKWNNVRMKDLSLIKPDCSCESIYSHLEMQLP